MSECSSWSGVVIGSRLGGQFVARAAARLLGIGGSEAAFKRVQGGLRRYAHRQGLDAAHKAGINPLRLTDHLDPLEPLQYLLPDDLQLQLGEPHADAAVDAETERQVDFRACPVNDELIGPLDDFFVAVA